MVSAMQPLLIVYLREEIANCLKEGENAGDCRKHGDYVNELYIGIVVAANGRRGNRFVFVLIKLRGKIKLCFDERTAKHAQNSLYLKSYRKSDILFQRIYIHICFLSRIISVKYCCELRLLTLFTYLLAGSVGTLNIGVVKSCTQIFSVCLDVLLVELLSFRRLFLGKALGLHFAGKKVYSVIFFLIHLIFLYPYNYYIYYIT